MILAASNSIVSKVGSIFQPIFKLFATILAAIYGVVPNYALSIIILTIVVMAVLTPLTVKSTKSMIAMQRMQPEIKKLQAKYKGAENREQLNAELMRLYKEEGINPAGGCIPILIQTPFLIILYDVIKGLTNTIPQGQKFASGPRTGQVCHATVCAEPRYIPTDSTMYHHLVASHGAMPAFGINLALKPFSHHGSVWAAIPYYALVAIAVALQFIQMRQMTKRNQGAAQANPQMQTMQKFMPILFAYIYFLVPAGVVLYMIVSTLIRIATQDIIFRTGIVQPVGERSVPAAGPAKSGWATRKADKVAPELEAGAIAADAAGNGDGGAKPAPKGGAGTPAKGGSSGTAKGSTAAKSAPAAKAAGTKTNGAKTTSNGAGANGTTNGDTAPKPHPRSKAKRARKAR